VSIRDGGHRSERPGPAGPKRDRGQRGKKEGEGCSSTSCVTAETPSLLRATHHAPPPLMCRRLDFHRHVFDHGCGKRRTDRGGVGVWADLREGRGREVL
jgi:hypothetical protein